MKLCSVCNKVVRNPLHSVKAEVFKETNLQDAVVCAEHKGEKRVRLPSLSAPGGCLEYWFEGEGQT